MQYDFFIRCDGKYIKVDARDICYFEALKNYVRIVTSSDTYLALLSLRQLEQELPEFLFCRVHRSFIVSLAHIQSFDHESVYLKEVSIPISIMYKNALLTKVKVLVSDTRTSTTANKTKCLLI